MTFDLPSSVLLPPSSLYLPSVAFVSESDCYAVYLAYSLIPCPLALRRSPTLRASCAALRSLPATPAVAQWIHTDLPPPSPPLSTTHTSILSISPPGLLYILPCPSFTRCSMSIRPPYAPGYIFSSSHFPTYQRMNLARRVVFRYSLPPPPLVPMPSVCEDGFFDS